MPALARNIPILITGCQRSGTTLLNLILDSHPEVKGVDEVDYNARSLQTYLESPDYHPYVSLKLPDVAHQIQVMKKIPEIKIIWCIRDPRDVVLSMICLKLMTESGSALSWAAHPNGSQREIVNCARTLQDTIDFDLSSLIRKFKALAVKKPELWSFEEAVFAASLCWRLKNELLKVYLQHGITYKIMRFENLLLNPEVELRGLLLHAGLQWHENVLKHHRLHSGVSTGGTLNTRPIDGSNTQKWKKVFSPEVLSIIKTVCANCAQENGYKL